MHAYAEARRYIRKQVCKQCKPCRFLTVDPTDRIDYREIPSPQCPSSTPSVTCLWLYATCYMPQPCIFAQQADKLLRQRHLSCSCNEEVKFYKRNAIHNGFCTNIMHGNKMTK